MITLKENFEYDEYCAIKVAVREAKDSRLKMARNAFFSNDVREEAADQAKQFNRILEKLQNFKEV